MVIQEIWIDNLWQILDKLFLSTGNEGRNDWPKILYGFPVNKPFSWSLAEKDTPTV